MRLRRAVRRPLGPEPGEIPLMIGAASADRRARASLRIARAGEGSEPAAAIFTPTSEEPIR